MGIASFIRGIFGKNATVYINGDISSDDNAPPEVTAREYATFAAISHIAAAFSMCEIRTFYKGTETFDGEYYRWNYHTNTNQTAAGWKYEFISRLLFFGEVLAVDCADQIIIADNFSHKQDPIAGDVFTNISRDGVAIADNLPRSRVIYCTHEFGGIRTHMARLMFAYDEWLKTASKQQERNAGERGIYHVDGLAQGDTAELEKQAEFVRRRFSKYFSSASAALPLYGSEEYTTTSTKSGDKDVDNINSLVDAEIKLACIAFHIPPALMRGETTGVKDITKNFISLAVKPLGTLALQEINAYINGKPGVRAGTKLMVDYTDIQYVDVFDVADKVEKLLGTSVFCVDDILRKLGESPRGTAESKSFILSKNFESTEEVK